MHSRVGFAATAWIHGSHLDIGVGVGLLHAVDVPLEGDLLSIARLIRIASFIGHIEVSQLLLLGAVRVHDTNVGHGWRAWLRGRAKSYADMRT